MKPGPWLLLAIGALCLVIARQRASADDAERLLLSCVHSREFPRFSGAAVPFSFLCFDQTGLDQDSQAGLDPFAEEDAATPLLRSSDPQSDDDTKADEGLFNNSRSHSTRRDQGNCLTEWRLHQPDTKHANSFINSKAMPPPL